VRSAVALAALLIAASTASAAPPRAGMLVPGKSLGGLSLGASRSDARAAWGARYGTCRGCRKPTWYFNFARFEPQGAGVTFERGRVVTIFTLWAPRGWRTSRGLLIGDPVARASALHRGFVRVNCGTYYALTQDHRRAVTSIYVHDEKVWGFGLSRPREPVCR
jgi:hypothetical protein